METLHVGEMVAEFFRVYLDEGVQALVCLDDSMKDAIGRLSADSPSMKRTWPLMSAFATTYFYPPNTGNPAAVDVDATINRLLLFFYDAGNTLKTFLAVLLLLERRAYELTQKKLPDAGCMPLACAFLGACVTRYWSSEFRPDDGVDPAAVQQELLSLMSAYTSLYAPSA